MPVEWITFAGVVLTALAGIAVAQVSSNRKIEVIHKIVNSQRAEMMAYQAELTEALREAGVEVPPQNPPPLDVSLAGGTMSVTGEILTETGETVAVTGEAVITPAEEKDPPAK